MYVATLIAVRYAKHSMLLDHKDSDVSNILCGTIEVATHIVRLVWHSFSF